MGSSGQPAKEPGFLHSLRPLLNSQDSLIQGVIMGKAVKLLGLNPVKASFQVITASQDWPEALRGKKSQLSGNDMAERTLCSCWGAYDPLVKADHCPCAVWATSFHKPPNGYPASMSFVTWTFKLLFIKIWLFIIQKMTPTVQCWLVI